MNRIAARQSGSKMKLWQAVIAALLMATLPVIGACSADKPYYSPDEVVVALKQRLDFFNSELPIEKDRYGARLVGKPLVTNFKLDDWDAVYLGDGKWEVSVNATYYEGISKQTGKLRWHFYEQSESIEYVDNGVETS